MQLPLDVGATVATAPPGSVPAIEPEWAEHSVAIVFDGPEHQGVMSADQLAAVLTGVVEYSQVVAAASRTARPGATDVKVIALTKSSFEIGLILQYAAAAVGVLGGLGTFFRFWWKNMRRAVVDFVPQPERRTVKVTFASGEVEEWPEGDWKVFSNAKARRSIQRMLRPFACGATSMKILDGGQEVLLLEAAQVVDFDELPPSGPEVTRQTITAFPDTVRFDPEKTWRVSTSVRGFFSAVIEDKSFLQDIALGRISIGKNDVFTLGIRIEGQEGGGEKPKYFIEKVIQYYPGGEQDSLPVAPGPEPED